MKKDEPHLYTKNTWLCYSGKPYPTVSYSINSFPLFDRINLCLLKDIRKVRITATNIIFHIPYKIEYSIPHTAKTYKECQRIFLTNSDTCGILKR